MASAALLNLMLVATSAFQLPSRTIGHGARAVPLIVPPPYSMQRHSAAQSAPRPDAIRCCAADESKEPTAIWVSNINTALEKGAIAYVLTYVLLDLGTALILCLLFLALRVNVAADFALAFAISKSPPLRGPRLGLDAVVAGALTKAQPQLAAVRVSLIADAMAQLMSLDTIRKRMGLRAQESSGGPADAVAAAVAVKPSSEPIVPTALPSNRLARAAAATRRLTDEYGLAYLVVKNVMGPLSIFAIYGAIRACTASGSIGASCGGAVLRASELVARLALGPGTRSFDGVRLPDVGQAAGCVCLASTVSSLMFPLVVVAAAKLTPSVAGWVAARLDDGEE